MLEKKILSTKFTPEITLNPDGFIRIKGRSMMNGDLKDFSEQVNEWINEYLCNPAESTSVDIRLEYFNQSNFKTYFDLLKKIAIIKLMNKKYIVNWYYEEGDDDILEKGESISSALDIPFNFIMIDDPLITKSGSANWKTKLN
jgi:hypothetical protein